MMVGITTHVLDTSRGRPAMGVPVKLEMQEGNKWNELGRGTTDEDGRCRTLLTAPPAPGTYRLTFDTRAYNVEGFFPEVTITFIAGGGSAHYHVPLLLSPYGYTTYRGS